MLKRRFQRPAALSATILFPRWEEEQFKMGPPRLLHNRWSFIGFAFTSGLRFHNESETLSSCQCHVQSGGKFWHFLCCIAKYIVPVHYVWHMAVSFRTSRFVRKSITSSRMYFTNKNNRVERIRRLRGFATVLICKLLEHADYECRNNYTHHNHTSGETHHHNNGK